MDRSKHLTYGASETVPISIFNSLGGSHIPGISPPDASLSPIDRFQSSDPPNYQFNSNLSRLNAYTFSVSHTHAQTYIYVCIDLLSSDPHILLCVCCKRIRNHVFRMTFFSPIFFFSTSMFSVAVVFVGEFKIHTRTGNYFATDVENQGS